MKKCKIAAALILVFTVGITTICTGAIVKPMTDYHMGLTSWPAPVEVKYQTLLDRLDTLAEVAEIIGTGDGNAGEGYGYLTVYQIKYDLAALLRGEFPFSVISSSESVMSVLDGYDDLSAVAGITEDSGYSRSIISGRVEGVIDGLDLLSSSICYLDTFEGESYGWIFEAIDLSDDLLTFVDAWQINDLISSDMVTELYANIPEDIIAEGDVPTRTEVRSAYAAILMERIYEDIEENFYSDIVESASFSFDEFRYTINSTVSRLESKVEEFEQGDITRATFKSILSTECEDLESLRLECETLVEAIEYYEDLISDASTASELYGVDIDWDDLCDKLF